MHDDQPVLARRHGREIEAAVWLHERMTPIKIAGATAVILGVALTRLGRKSPVVVAIEE